MNNKITLLLLLLGILLSSQVSANLLISPTRVAFDDRQRSSEITLINSGSSTKSYRVEWTNQKMSEAGRYITLSESEMKTFPKASDYIRISPRQVTLKSGERQTVKLLARRSRDMANGEYRSHLRFTALPDKTAKKASGMAISLNMLTSYSIPVILRKGTSPVSASISSVEFIPGEAQQLDINIGIKRFGAHSLAGRLKVFHTSLDGKERQVGLLNGINVFTEVTQRYAPVEWENFKNENSGQLRVVYEGTDEYKGTVLAERTVRLGKR